MGKQFLLPLLGTTAKPADKLRMPATFLRHQSPQCGVRRSAAWFADWAALVTDRTTLGTQRHLILKFRSAVNSLAALLIVELFGNFSFRTTSL
jgi:hypothetical protein